MSSIAGAASGTGSARDRIFFRRMVGGTYMSLSAQQSCHQQWSVNIPRRLTVRLLTLSVPQDLSVQRRSTRPFESRTQGHQPDGVQQRSSRGPAGGTCGSLPRRYGRRVVGRLPRRASSIPRGSQNSQLGRETFWAPVEWADHWPIVTKGKPITINGLPEAGLERLPEEFEQRHELIRMVRSCLKASRTTH